jgi:hypothetical protein
VWADDARPVHSPPLPPHPSPSPPPSDNVPARPHPIRQLLALPPHPPPPPPPPLFPLGAPPHLSRQLLTLPAHLPEQPAARTEAGSAAAGPSSAGLLLATLDEAAVLAPVLARLQERLATNTPPAAAADAAPWPAPAPAAANTDMLRKPAVQLRKSRAEILVQVQAAREQRALRNLHAPKKPPSLSSADLRARRVRCSSLSSSQPPLAMLTCGPDGYGARFSTEESTLSECHNVSWLCSTCSYCMHAAIDDPLGCSLLLPVGTVNCVQTLKVGRNAPVKIIAFSDLNYAPLAEQWYDQRPSGFGCMFRM